MSDSRRTFFDLPFAWQGAILALITLPIWILFAFIGQTSKGEILWFLAVVILLNAIAQWDLHEHRWFRPAFTVLFVAHLPLVWWDPLHGKHVVGALITPFVFADYAFVYAVLLLVRKFFDKASRS